jgi:hypothetical protein
MHGTYRCQKGSAEVIKSAYKYKFKPFKKFLTVALCIQDKRMLFKNNIPSKNPKGFRLLYPG